MVRGGPNKSTQLRETIVFSSKECDEKWSGSAFGGQGHETIDFPNKNVMENGPDRS